MPSEKAIKYYKSIYDISVYNWHMLNTTNNMDYLLILDDYDDVPEHFINLGKVYMDLVRQLPHADTTIQVYWIDAKKLHLDHIAGRLKSVGTLHRKFTQYRTSLDEIYKNFRFGDKIYKNSTELFKYVREISKGKDQLIANQFAIFDINQVKAEPIHSRSILEDLADLGRANTVYYDPKKVSLGMFYNIYSSTVKASSKNTKTDRQ